MVEKGHFECTVYRTRYQHFLLRLCNLMRGKVVIVATSRGFSSWRPLELLLQAEDVRKSALSTMPFVCGDVRVWCCSFF